MLRMVDQGKDQWIAPEEVAEAMLALIQKPDYVGRTALEVGLRHVRTVSMLGDPGPSGPGIMVSNAVNYENAV
jgi:3-hydroxybutyrate dehydrogenase